MLSQRRWVRVALFTSNDFTAIRSVVDMGPLMFEPVRRVVKFFLAVRTLERFLSGVRSDVNLQIFVPRKAFSALATDMWLFLNDFWANGSSFGSGSVETYPGVYSHVDLHFVARVEFPFPPRTFLPFANEPAASRWRLNKNTRKCRNKIAVAIKPGRERC